METCKKRMPALRGFTLVEVMVAAVILVAVSVGAITLAMRSYEIAAKARLSDNARNVLRTYADQFLRLSIENVSRAVFLVETQQFEDLRGNFAASFTEPLGSATSAGVITATVRRSVEFVDLTDGTDRESVDRNQAGCMLKATFTATYPFNGKDQTVTFTLLRAVP